MRSVFTSVSASLLTDVLTPANHASIQSALINLLPLAPEAHAEIRKFEPLSCALFLGLLRVEVCCNFLIGFKFTHLIV